LNPARYGELALCLTVVALINQVITGGITAAASRYFNIAIEKNEAINYIKSVAWLTVMGSVATLIFGIIIIIVLNFMEYISLIELSIITLVFSIFNGFNSTLLGIQNAARKRHVVAVLSGLEAWLKIGIVVAVMHWLGSSSKSVVIGYLITTILINISQLILIYKLIANNKIYELKDNYKNKIWVKEMWEFAWPFSAWGFFTWLQLASDRWALKVFQNSESVGEYTVLYQLGFLPIALASGIVVSLVGPIINQHAGDGTDKNKIQKIYKITELVIVCTLVITVISSVIIYHINENLYKMFTNSKYHNTSYLMHWMVIAGGLHAAHHIVGLRFTALMKVKKILIPQIISAFMFLILNSIGAYNYGVEGLVFAFLLASLIYFLWIYILSQYVIKTKS
jgi:O-antigen/teichoic acid export membrane protein